MLPFAGGNRLRISLFLSPLLLAFLASAPLTYATDISWDGSNSTAWSNKFNWTPKTNPGPTDNAKFDATFSNQPTLGSTAQSIGGIWMTTGVGQNVTISGTATLTLASNTINGTAGLGILVNNSSSFTLTIDAPVLIGASQAWTNNSGNVLTIGAVNLSSFALTVNGSGSTIVSGVVSGSGSITKSGTGTLTLTGTNNYTGSTTISAGILNIQNATALGTTASGTTISNGATLQLEGGITVGAEALSIRGTGAAGQNGALVNVSGTNNYGGLLTLAAATTISSDSGTLNLTNAGTITGATFGLTLTGSGNGSISSIIGTTSGTVTTSGSGTWTFSGTNTFTGALTVANGNLSIATINNASANGVLGNSANAVVLGSSGTTGTLQYTGSTASSTKKFTMATGGTGAFQIDSSGTTLTLSGIIDGSGALLKTGAGTLSLSGVNTYSGGTTISAGTLQLSGSGTLGSTSGSLTVNGGTLNLNGTNQGVGNLTGSGGTILNNATGTNVTLTIGNGNGTGGNYAGVIANRTSGTGTVALTKTGTGTITLSGINTFTGATTVNGGTLILAAAPTTSALGSTTSITVNSGGTLLLGGDHQINNSATMTLAGGTFAKGNFNEGSTTVAGIGALTLTATGSHINFGTGSVGVITFASFNPGVNILNIDNWTGTASTVGSSGTDRLIFNSDQTLNLALFQFAGYAPGAIQFNLGSGFYEVVPTAVPEPATYLAALLILGALGWSQRRRWRHRWSSAKIGSAYGSRTRAPALRGLCPNH